MRRWKTSGHYKSESRALPPLCICRIYHPRVFNTAKLNKNQIEFFLERCGIRSLNVDVFNCMWLSDIMKCVLFSTKVHKNNFPWQVLTLAFTTRISDWSVNSLQWLSMRIFCRNFLIDNHYKTVYGSVRSAVLFLHGVYVISGQMV